MVEAPVSETRPVRADGGRALRILVRSSVLVGALIGLYWYWAESLTGSQTATRVRGPATSLKTIASAQGDFYGNDRDGNRIQDFWRDDIAGLYTVLPEGSHEAVKLIELAIAAADAAPVKAVAPPSIRAPKAGYWFRALRFADEDPRAPDPERFAACAFPDSPSAGRDVFIVSHQNRVYRRPWTGPQETPSAYPADPLKEGWSPLD